MTQQNENYLSAVVIEPESHHAERSVIWLHGLGADGNDFVPLIPELKLPKEMNIRFVFPHAPVMPITMNNGYEMRAWFDIVSLTSSASLDEAGIANSVEMVQQLITRETTRGVALDKIILAGFSQGGVIALYTGLTYPARLGGIIGLSTFLPIPQSVLANRTAANQAIPIFLAHGTEDAMVPYVLGERTRRALKQAGYSVSWHEYAMPHSVCPEEVQDIRQWLTTVNGNGINQK